MACAEIPQGFIVRRLDMFPLEFDYEILATLPMPNNEDIRRVGQILEAIMTRRVIPYFKKRRGTDSIVLAKAMKKFSIARLEDEAGQVRIISLLTRKDDAWSLMVHERIFDYLAFVIPSDPDSRLGNGTLEERKMLAFAELLLRHDLEHILYHERKERDIIHADVEFAMDRRATDPTFYQMLRQALADEMNGIRGEPYLTLFDQAERQQPVETVVIQIVNDLVKALGDLSSGTLEEFFLFLDEELKTKILGEYCRRSNDTSLSLVQRAAQLQRILRLFKLLVDRDEKEAQELFSTFKERWGLAVLFRELQFAEASIEDKKSEELFQLFKSALSGLAREKKFSEPAAPRASAMKVEEAKGEVVKEKTLKDRIEEARDNREFPPLVLEVIDKNKINAVGHSGAKYSELIETLLAIPWGKIEKVQVSPESFERGLNESHYGLARPKEIVCDFFTNLIWRYQFHREGETSSWRRMGSAFLFVGPPGVGKTSFAISIAQNLGIPYHKFSLGGMRDEADLRGHGFTYEGSKPGAIVQGLIKMGVMNGMFILDEADKTEKFAIATLLEILDPEQNHLFHDKYTQTTVDIDLSNCHFILTANTLETVPPPVVNRCEVVMLDRYSVEEKVAIAKLYLVRRIRSKHQITEKVIFFDKVQEEDLLRYLVKNYTYEAGVRQLERVIRTLFLRIQRKEILTGECENVRVTRSTIKTYLEEPGPPRQVNEEDRVGETLGLGVDPERGVGTVIPIQATAIPMASAARESWRGPLSVIHATGNIQKVMDESRKVATTGILTCAEALGIDSKLIKDPIHLHFMGGSTRKDGPSSGGAIALALASLLCSHKIRRDVTMTGEIDTQGRITAVGALDVKLDTAFDAGCKTVIIPEDNLTGKGGLERLPDALKEELQILTYKEWKQPHAPFDYSRHVLQVVAVKHIVEAVDIAFIYEPEIQSLRTPFLAHADKVAEHFRQISIDSTRSPLIIQLKSLVELSSEQIEASLWKRIHCYTLLVTPQIRKTILDEFPDLEKEVEFRDLDIGRQELSQVMEEILSTYSRKPASQIHVALVAPFFLLKQDGLLEGLADRFPSVRSLDVFANNYTVQEVKIKNCKALLNLTYCYLSHLGKELIEACPFLGKRNGIYVVDLSFIPEKYRLDVHRAEQILNDCLGQWVRRVEEKSKGVEI
jgi:endopeptidase La